MLCVNLNYILDYFPLLILLDRGRWNFSFMDKKGRRFPLTPLPSACLRNRFILITEMEMLSENDIIPSRESES